MIKFNTNYIRTGKSKSFKDLIEEATQKKEALIKTASKEEETVKVAEAGGEGAASKKEKDEADSSGQPEWEGKKENVNDPEAGDHHTDEDVGKQASEDESNTESEDEEKEEEEDTKETEVKEAEVKEAADVKDADNESNSEADSSGQPEWEGKKENVNDPEAGKHHTDGDVGKQASDKEPKKDKEDTEDTEDTEETKETETDESAEASSSPKYVKIANLDDKSKSWLRTYWSELYPPEYVDAMVADK